MSDLTPEEKAESIAHHILSATSTELVLAEAAKDARAVEYGELVAFLTACEAAVRPVSQIEEILNLGKASEGVRDLEQRGWRQQEEPGLLVHVRDLHVLASLERHILDAYALHAGRMVGVLLRPDEHVGQVFYRVERAKREVSRRLSAFGDSERRRFHFMAAFVTQVDLKRTEDKQDFKRALQPLQATKARRKKLRQQMLSDHIDMLMTMSRVALKEELGDDAADFRSLMEWVERETESLQERQGDPIVKTVRTFCSRNTKAVRELLLPLGNNLESLKAEKLKGKLECIRRWKKQILSMCCEDLSGLKTARRRAVAKAVTVECDALLRKLSEECFSKEDVDTFVDECERKLMEQLEPCLLAEHGGGRDT